MGPAAPLEVAPTSVEAGKAAQTKIVGRPVTGPLSDFAPGVNTSLQRHLFGDLFGRDILDHESRELATLGALSSVEGVAPQLKAHMTIAANVGLTQAQLQDVANVLSAVVGTQEGQRAEQAFDAAF
nr:carboxymuconolactone decarboxylase family protein [Motiliproteus sp. SC1-56]